MHWQVRSVYFCTLKRIFSLRCVEYIVNIILGSPTCITRRTYLCGFGIYKYICTYIQNSSFKSDHHSISLQTPIRAIPRVRGGFTTASTVVHILTSTTFPGFLRRRSSTRAHARAFRSPSQPIACSSRCTCTCTFRFGHYRITIPLKSTTSA